MQAAIKSGLNEVKQVFYQFFWNEEMPDFDILCPIKWPTER